MVGVDVEELVGSYVKPAQNIYSGQNNGDSTVIAERPRIHRFVRMNGGRSRSVTKTRI